MRKIVYYVAISIDGFIEGPGADTSGFVAEGDGLQQYLSDLETFDTVIMGRKTYEFGYQYGLKPGQPAYAHMKHYIFSDSLQFEKQHENVHVCALDLDIVQNLKKTEGTDIYLCGGSVFAGWLLKNGLIDVLKIKLNPFVMGKGTPLFQYDGESIRWKRISVDEYEDGLTILTYHRK